MLTIPTKKSHHYPALFCLNRSNNYEDSIVHVKQCEETEADKNINLNNAEQADVDGDEDMDEDDDVNKLDKVAVAQRLKQWQSSKRTALAQACASVPHFTGVNDTSEVEEHFRRQLTLRG